MTSRRALRYRQPMMALALLASGCSATAATVPRDAPAVATSTAVGPRVWIQEPARVIPLDNGQTVTRGDDVIEIFLTPYPPGRTSNVDFYVTRGGTPVTANVTLQWDMTLMDHGPFELSAVPDGRGHYLARLEFFMNGDFWLNVSIRTPGSEAILNLLVRAIR